MCNNVRMVTNDVRVRSVPVSLWRRVKSHAGRKGWRIVDVVVMALTEYLDREETVK